MPLSTRSGLAVAMACMALVAACSGAEQSAGQPSTTRSPATSPTAESSAALPPVTTSRPTTTLEPPTTAPSTTTSNSTADENAVETTVHLPEEAGQAPLVVLIPGGGWHSADPSQLDGLARHLAGAGNVAVTARIRAFVDGVSYPLPLDDISCAIRQGRREALESGIDVGPVVLVGHSSGAHLSALVALGTDEFACDEEIDAMIGLAGAYDVTRLPALAVLLFGVSPEDDPDLWERGNPLLQANLRPEMPVLLLHGDADPLLPISFSEDFAQALEDAGHTVDVTVIPGADHVEIFSAAVVGDLIDAWIDHL